VDVDRSHGDGCGRARQPPVRPAPLPGQHLTGRVWRRRLSLGGSGAVRGMRLSQSHFMFAPHAVIHCRKPKRRRQTARRAASTLASSMLSGRRKRRPAAASCAPLASSECAPRSACRTSFTASGGWLCSNVWPPLDDWNLNSATKLIAGQKSRALTNWKWQIYHSATTATLEVSVNEGPRRSVAESCHPVDAYVPALRGNIAPGAEAHGSSGELLRHVNRGRKSRHYAGKRCLKRSVLPATASAFFFSVYAEGSAIQRLMADSRQPQQCSLIRTCFGNVPSRILR
jgi:hypothetical protein